MCQYVCERDKDGDEEGEGENDGEDRGRWIEHVWEQDEDQGGSREKRSRDIYKPDSQNFKI